MTDRGIIFVAIGEKCQKEFELAYRSLRNIDKHIHVTVYADGDRGIDGSLSDQNLDIVKIYTTDAKSFRIETLIAPPYKENLYVDTDVYFLEPFEQIFEVLKRVDIAVSQTFQNKDKNSEISDAFPIFNSGIIVFNKNERTLEFFSDWLSRYNNKKHIQKFDEPSFRESMFYHASLAFSILPVNYNFRVEQAQRVNGRVKILHGKNLQHSPSIEKINRTDVNRLYLPTGEVIEL